jgi:hypothetical protein
VEERQPWEVIPKASHSASIIASIMHIDPIKMLIWQLIKEERVD